MSKWILIFLFSCQLHAADSDDESSPYEKMTIMITPPASPVFQREHNSGPSLVLPIHGDNEQSGKFQGPPSSSRKRLSINALPPERPATPEPGNPSDYNDLHMPDSNRTLEMTTQSSLASTSSMHHLAVPPRSPSRSVERRPREYAIEQPPIEPAQPPSYFLRNCCVVSALITIAGTLTAGFILYHKD